MPGVLTHFPNGGKSVGAEIEYSLLSIKFLRYFRNNMIPMVRLLTIQS